MLKYYLKSAIRNFKTNRLISAGSIVTAFLCALCISLLFTYVHNELTMDNFHKREKDIYLLTIQQSLESQVRLIEASKFFDFNKDNYPEIDKVTTLQKYDEGELKFRVEESVYTPEGIVADSSFFDVFDFKLKLGEETTILSEPGVVVLTEKLARKFFNTDNPIGKTIKVVARTENVYTVKGIVETPPANSSIKFDFILSKGYSGFDRSGADIILANHNFDPVEFSEKIKNIGNAHIQYKQSVCGIIPLDEMYYSSHTIGTKKIFSRSGDKRNTRTLILIMGIIFVISVLNFSNLQIIHINSTLKNIGISRIIGAGGKHIFFQKITYIFILVFISAILITLAFVLVLPFFNQITDVVLSPETWKIFLLNFIILISLVGISMIYPSVVFLRVPITRSLKSQFFAASNLAGKNVVNSVQFALTIVLLIVSMVVVKQLNFMLNKDLGFKSENIIITKYFQHQRLDGTQEERNRRREMTAKNYEYVKNELAAHSSIKYYSQGGSPFKASDMPWKYKESDRDYTSGKVLGATPEYFELMGLQLVEGRLFDNEKDKPYDNKIVINEAAKKFWGIEDILGKRILNKYWSYGNDAEGFVIIGVVKNFNCEHLSQKTKPLYLINGCNESTSFLIEFEPGATEAGLQFAQKLFNEINPGETFQYSFLSDEMQTLYQKEKRLAKIYIIFTVIAFLVSAIGLFTISLYDTRKRTKEIGVRKVNGAKITEILAMLNKDLLKWVIISFMIACPIAWYAMSKWLENFAFKTRINWWIFAFAGAIALVIALFTVSFQSYRAANRNPLEALRHE